MKQQHWRRKYFLFLYVDQISINTRSIWFLKCLLNTTHYIILLPSFQFLGSPFLFRISICLRICRGQLDRCYHFEFTKEDTEVLYNQGEVTIQGHKTSPWSRATAITQLRVVLGPDYGSLAVLDSICLVMCLPVISKDWIHKTTSFAWFPELLIVPLFIVYLVDNKSIR